MSLKQFLFYIAEKDGRSNYINNGIVDSRGTRTPIMVAPIGWQEIAFAWERNLSKHGISRSFSKELAFPGDGYKMLAEFFHTKNVDIEKFLIIQQLGLEYGPTFYKWLYSYLYKGEFDFTTAKDNPEDGIFKISIMEGGLSKLLNASQSTLYDIPFDDDAETLEHDGIDILNKVQGIVEEVYGDDGAFYFKNHIPRLNLTTAESSFFGGSRSTNRVQVTNSNTAIRATKEYFFKATVDTAMDIEYNLKFTLAYTPSSPAPNPAAEYRIVIREIDENNLFVQQEELFLRVSSDGFNGTFNPSGSVTMNVSKGNELYLFAFCQIIGSTGDDQIRTVWVPDENTIFKATFTYRHPTSFIKGFTRAMLWRKLCRKVLGHEDYAVSSLFDADNRLIFSGDSLRGINGAYVKTCINDFFTDADCDLWAGMSIENGSATTGLAAGQRLLIETRTRYYDESNPIELGEVNELEITYAKEWVASAVKVGWKEPSIEDVNGKYEFNGTQVYTMPIKRVSKEYNLISPYKAGPIDIEMIRINTEGKTTTDKDSDNDVFVIVAEKKDLQYYDLFSFAADGNIMTKPSGFHVAPGMTISVSQSASNDGSYEVRSVNGNLVVLDSTLTDEASVACLVEITSGKPVWILKREDWDNDDDPEDFGVASPTSLFNYDLSPHRKLLRHGRWLRSMLHDYDTDKVLFSSGTRNYNLKTIKDGVTVKENADVPVSALGDKLWIPKLITFKKDTPVNLVEIKESNPNRCFSFTYNGETYKGFELKCGLDVSTLEEQVISLISVPGNDFTKLKP